MLGSARVERKAEGEHERTDVSSGLELSESESDQGLPRLRVAVLLHQPSRRLRAEVDSDRERQGGDERRSELKSPRDRLEKGRWEIQVSSTSTDAIDRNGICTDSGVLHDDVCGESEEDSERGPELPSHDERSSDGGGRELSGEDGHGRSLGSHSDTEQQSDDEQLLPGLSEPGADRCDDEDERGQENDSSSTEDVVERVREPASDEGGGNVRGGVDL